MPYIFWTVWLGKQLAMVRRYPSQESAEKAAGEIAQLNPGKHVYVLQAISYFLTEPAPVQAYKLDPAPKEAHEEGSK